MITYKGKGYKVCSTCKGKCSRQGYEHVRHGICFTCEGWGSVELAKKIIAEQNKKLSDKNAVLLKEEVAYRYKKIQKLISQGRIEIERKAANDAYKQLVGMGIRMTIDEIKELAEKL
jgi:RecJ-like exonuclease